MALVDEMVEINSGPGLNDAAELLEEEHTVGKLGELPGLLGSQPGIEEVLNPPPVVQEGDDAVAGAGQRPGAVQDPLEHRPEVQALVDAQAASLRRDSRCRRAWFSRARSPAFSIYTTSVQVRTARDVPARRASEMSVSALGEITQQRLAGNWWEIGVLSGRVSTDFTQHSVSYCPGTYPNLRQGRI